ncbi:MAG: NAD(P)/FAD-dependent oxidoreductase [Nitrospinales bacterium]
MKTDLKPLRNEDTVCILGGGPGGASCAIALKNEAARLGKEIHVVILEQKKFGEHRHFNQCIGVLSPPLETILGEKLNLSLPANIVLREIKGYCLHSDRLSVNLDGNESGKTFAVNRSKFDAFMIEQAKKTGAVVLHSRATGIEISDDEVIVYSEGENCHAAVVVGAFGLDDGSCKIFEQATPYRQPDFLNTIITRLSPGEDFLRAMGPTIHAFLLSHPGLEFGAVTPKDDHLSVNVAGRHVTSRVMLDFLRSSQVQGFLPPHTRQTRSLNYFKGKFPIAPAKHLYGDRYVTIGDAAGLIRPFKGKGINSACLTGVFAARTIMNHGVSKSAFERYAEDCAELTGDLPFGRVLRLMTNLASRFQFMDHLLKIAEDDPVFMACLFNCVSGHKPYKQIFKETASVRLGMRMLGELVRRFILRKL